MITLRNETLSATFDGFTLVSFTKGGLDVIAKGTASSLVGPRRPMPLTGAWQIDATETLLKGTLTGKEPNFKILATASLTTCLEINLSIVSDIDSLIGFQCCFALPSERGQIVSDTLTHDLKEPIDGTFHPFLNPLSGKILLTTPLYTLETRYFCPCQENSWLLQKSANSSNVSITPVSSKDPLHPNLTVSSLHIQIAIS